MAFFRKTFGKQFKPKSPSSPKRSPQSPGAFDLSNGDMGESSDMLMLKSNKDVKSKHLLSHSTTCSSLQDCDIGDLGSLAGLPDTQVRTKSRLTKTFQEVLNDKEALAYLIQYMESRKSVHLIKFWLETESFHASTWSRIRSHSLNAMRKSMFQGSNNTKKTVEFVQSMENATDNQCSSGINPAERPDSESDQCNSDSVNSSIDACQADDASVNKSIEQTDTLDCSSKSDLIYLDIRNEDPIGEKLRKSIEHDAVTIYSKYISLDASYPIEISDELRNETIRNICREDGQVDPQSFIECQKVVLAALEKDYFPEFLTSEYQCKYQIDVLTSGTIYLADIFYNDIALFYFMEFMELEGAMALLEFLMAVDNFKEHLVLLKGNYDGIQAQGDAMIIYNKYFSLQASTPLGVEDTIRFEIESNICRDGGPLPNCFDITKNIVMRHIEKSYFNAFVRSELFYKYLNDLITTVQSKETLTIQKRRGSDASSEASVGVQSTCSSNEPVSYWNTLVGSTDNNQAIRKALNKVSFDLRIDTKLFNPDSLWERESSGKITLGHINQFGQFVSEFDHEPDHEKKANGLFSNKKKKDKEKAQEDMAWQIAQMIVRDVTSLSDQSYENEDGEIS